MKCYEERTHIQLVGVLAHNVVAASSPSSDLLVLYAKQVVLS